MFPTRFNDYYNLITINKLNTIGYRPVVVRQIFQQNKDGGAARDIELRAQRACVLLPGANYFPVRRIFRYTGILPLLKRRSTAVRGTILPPPFVPLLPLAVKLFIISLTDAPFRIA